MSRNKKKAVNTNNQYKEIFEERGVNRIEQYRTPTLKEVPDTIPTFEYIWKYGDNFAIIAHKFFKNKKYWYVIAQLNNKPTEAHVEIGETIKIPYDINLVLQVLR